MKKAGWTLAVAVVVAVAAASAAYAGSALQLYEQGGIQYVKHVNYNAGSSAKTWLLIKNCGAPGTVQVKYSARALDGTQVGGTQFVGLRSGESRTLWLAYSKPITDLNFLQLLKKAKEKAPPEEP